jgi:hypothetical protein
MLEGPQAAAAAGRPLQQHPLLLLLVVGVVLHSVHWMQQRLQLVAAAEVVA